LTSAAALPLSTARSSLETSLSRSCSTATTKRSLFRLMTFAKSQRGSHECRPPQNDLAALTGERIRHEWVRRRARVTLRARLGDKNIQHTVRYTELAPDRFKDFWR